MIKFILLGSFCLSGCHGIKTGTYPEQGDMKKGPGLFTGKQGEFTFLSSQETLNTKSLENFPDLQKAPSFSSEARN